MQESECKKILSHIVAAEIYSNTFEQVAEIITDIILIKGDDDKVFQVCEHVNKHYQAISKEIEEQTKVFQVCEHVNKHYFSFVSAYVDKLISDI
jgi:uncharacterized protein YwlG (UPF0340 family)